MKSEASPLIGNGNLVEETTTQKDSNNEKRFKWFGILVFGLFVSVVIIIAGISLNASHSGHGVRAGGAGSMEKIVEKASGSSQSPNIIYILMDDMGYADFSARGSEFETPNLDLLYETSIVLNSHYIGLVCSPSRSQIITGRYAWNMGLSDQTAFGSVQLASFPAALPTIGNLLSEYTNYQSYFTGKWHMGHVTTDHLPLQRGFSKFYGFYTSNIKYSDKTISSISYDEDYIDWRSMDQVDHKTQYDYSTYVTGDTMTDIISSHIDTYSDNTPFYMHVPFQALHATLEYVESDNMATCDSIEELIEEASDADAEDEDADATDDTSDDDDNIGNRLLMCQNILAVDQVIGDLINNLKNVYNIWDNTLIIFTSDNGASYKKGGCNYPLRGGKDTYFEGGIKTVGFVSGGYVTPSQMGTFRDEFMHGVDWTPTILGMAGANVAQIEEDLQNKLYIPASKSVSQEMFHNEERYQDYLMDSSFDGNDVSEWLLYGSDSETPNVRTKVPLGINTNDEDSRSNDIAMVFTSQITGHAYKLMYLNEAVTTNKNIEWCNYDSVQRSKSEVSKSEWVQTDSLLFDLTLEPNEATNLMQIDSEEGAIISESYSYDTKLVESLWEEGMSLVEEEMDNPMFNEFLNCQNSLLSDAADPSKFDDAYSPFYTWEEYVSKFARQCGSSTNPLLTQLFTTKYHDY